MRNWQASARTGGAVLASGVLGGCSAVPVDGLGGTVALLLVAVTAAAAGWLLGRQQGRRALHAARQESRLLGQLAGGERWRTQAAPGQPPQLEDGQRLDQRFDVGNGAAALEAALARPEPLGPVAARLAGGQTPCTLRALPWFADDGSFGGHLGVALPPDADGQPARALAALAQAWPDVLAVLVRPGPGAEGAAPWQLLQASAAARPRLGEPDVVPHARLHELLPTALQPLLSTPGQAEAEGWQLVHLVQPQGALLLLWRAGAAVAEETATLSYTVSHDLRAPIRVVEGFTRIVKEDYGAQLDRVANDHLDRVLGAAARMNQMIDAMLTLARLSSQPLARQPVNLTQLAGFVVDDLRRSAPEREARIEIEPGLQATGDPTLLRLVLENLLGNAWKYSARRAQAHIVFGRETVDGRSVFVVRDNGAGFDMRSAERLFGLFQRLHSASEFSGTGVGLASVRRIVQRHGGEIWADGEPGRGAAFFFTLPDLGTGRQG